MVTQGWRIPLDQEQSLVARAARTRQGVIVNDVRQDPGFFQNPLLPKTQAELAVPLLAGTRLIGVLDVQAEKVNHFTKEDVRIQTTLAAQIAVSLENTHLLETARRNAVEAEQLYNASRRISQADDLQDVAAAVSEVVSDPALNRAVLFTFEYDPTGQVEAILVTANWYRGSGLRPTEAGVRYGRETFDLTNFISGEPLFFDDVFDDERVTPSWTAVCERLKIASAAVLPLQAGVRQLGTLLLEAETSHHFTDREKRAFIALAQQMAVAVENRRLLEGAQTRAHRERILREVTAQVRRSVDVDTIMRTVVQEVGRVLNRPAFVHLDSDRNGDAPSPATNQEEV